MCENSFSFLLISHPSSMRSHVEAGSCFLQLAQGTVLLLFHLSISSEYSPRAGQTCRLRYQDSLSWLLAFSSQISEYTIDERHHCRHKVCLCRSSTNSANMASKFKLANGESVIFPGHPCSVDWVT